jgi:hypothetical protein
MVKELVKRSSARSRADALGQRTCRYLRNEGYDAFQKGDVKRIGIVNGAYERAIRTIAIMSGVSQSDRERLIKDLKHAYESARNGIRLGVMMTPINEANGALLQVVGVLGMAGGQHLRRLAQQLVCHHGVPPSRSRHIA